MGPQTRAAEATHAMKYRQENETFRDAANRVAGTLKDSPEHYHQFRDILLDMRFSPAGRVQSAIGAIRQTTPYNCYVSGTIADSFIEGSDSIMERAKEAAATMRLGGGIGYDFSTLRPRGALIKKLQSHSTGPMSFMNVFNEICKCVASSGHRRGAQMGVLRVDHPDILEFVNAKHNQDVLSGFNLSIGITDEFMEAVARGSSFKLRFGGETYREVDAGDLWETIMRSTWDWAEPGVLFIDTINKMNNLQYCETIAATNPCGEQPLPPFGACLLGSFNLVKYLHRQPVSVADISAGIAGPGYSFDFAQLVEDIPAVVRAMDNVVDNAIYPLPQQEEEAKNKRRMGLGVMGLANAAEAMGYPYGSEQFVAFETKVLKLIANESYRASALLAKEKGSFPLYSAEHYLKAPFIKTLDADVQFAIGKYGIRNSHLTSIAPTGTISMCADNVSSSIEPVFSYTQRRPIQTPDGPLEMRLDDYGVRFLGVRGKRCDEVSVQEHVKVLVAAAKCVDSAVSKTCNMDGTVPWEDFKNLYKTAWEGGAKGCTTFNKDGKRFALLTSDDEVKPIEEAGEACRIDLETGRRECA
ncbi:MAG: nrdJ [Candidatus Saccharibacteria bacterium]|nr:nrdJ [Candidatus Saccharibacteria bacterium]